ncbi:hypothetical protein SPI_00667 [Niveomyces insectorum RCEF 264]|uniref:Glycosyltransferase 2-like domain-containing protein n=1 Tax=Niveomyces insectorum RCEF 264 TaxID=1081102 RepID=A0A162JG66_9HYPO|nr:hypothetical protein SPI_00667 [Niveomyces insectorum RCEF 264]
MSLFGWCARRSGGLAMVLLSILCYWVVSKEAAASRYGYKVHPQNSLSAPRQSFNGAGFWTVLFSWYCLLIHLLVFAFPLRACWAIWDLTSSLRRTARSKTLRDYKFAHQHHHSRRGSSTSLSSSETLTSSRVSSAASSEAGDVESEFYTDEDAVPERVVHAVIIPNYKEEMDTLRETLDVLASHPQARKSYDIYLAMEQRENNAELKAMSLIAEFVRKFRSIDFTLHPSDLPNECPGKGSNVDWAARKLSEKYPTARRKDVIVTGIDVTTMHITYAESAATTMYSAPIIFDRNAHNVPAIVRVADILWCAAGYSGLYRGSTISPPTSVYSLPLQLVDQVGGWDCTSEAIGEDLHMYLKCFFALNGNLTVRTVLSPISQSNVTAGGHGKGVNGTILDIRARYKQALRHMWGALDTGFALRKAVELWQDRKHTSRAFRPLHSSLSDSTDTYVPDTQLDALAGTTNSEQPAEVGIFSDVTRHVLKEPNYTRFVYLFHRLFEAHFLPVHMTILVVASTLYVWVTDGTEDTHRVGWIFEICKYLRTAGFMQIAFYLLLYENFHKIALSIREKEMTDAGLAKGMNFSHRNIKQNFVDYLMVPLVAPLYGAIPCAQAQISHFWTLDLVYTVSKKVTRQRAKSTTADTMA